MWRSWRLVSFALGCLVAALLSLQAHAARPEPRRVAVVAGISSYDAATRVPQLPACETSARALIAALDGQAKVHPLLRRVSASDLLDTVRQASASCAESQPLLVFVVAAADDGGVVASDRRVTVAELRSAAGSGSDGPRILCIDAPQAAGLAPDGHADAARDVLPARDGEPAVLVSTRSSQRAWSRFFPHDDFVRFESAAAHGWVRALEKVDGDWGGDLGRSGGVSLGDLQMCGDEDAGQSIPQRDGRPLEARQPLDAELGLRVIEAVRPSAARRLRRGRDVPIDDLRTDMGRLRFEQLTGVLEGIRAEALADADSGTRFLIRQSLSRPSPLAALQALHDLLLREERLDTPSPVEVLGWARLSPDGKGRVALVGSASQRARLRGRACLAVLGSTRRIAYRVPYGRFAGDLDRHVQARLRVELLGSCLQGRWEGELDGRWMRGDWQGTFDPRTGKIQGRILSRLQDEGGGAERPRDVSWPALFDGQVSQEGGRLSGTWRSATPMRPVEGTWSVDR